MRRFAYTVTVTDSRGRPVAGIEGESEVTNDRKSLAEICQTITDGLPAHLRRADYGHHVSLQEL